jgi:hypothetical protein
MLATRPTEPSAPLAAWTRPAWATRTRLGDEVAVQHTLDASTPAFARPEALDAEPMEVLPELSQTDDVEVGALDVTVRRGELIVTVDSLQFNVDQARVLALGLLEILNASAAVGTASADFGTASDVAAVAR